MQSNARRIFNNRWDDKGRLGKFAKLGLAPVLWAVIIGLLLIFINSVITCTYSCNIQVAFSLKIYLRMKLYFKEYVRNCTLNHDQAVQYSTKQLRTFSY